MKIFGLVWGPPALAYGNHLFQSFGDAMALSIILDENKIDKNKWDVNWIYAHGKY